MNEYRDLDSHTATNTSKERYISRLIRLQNFSRGLLDNVPWLEASLRRKSDVKGVSCVCQVHFSTGVALMTTAAAILEQMKETRPKGRPPTQSPHGRKGMKITGSHVNQALGALGGLGPQK